VVQAVGIFKGHQLDPKLVIDMSYFDSWSQLTLPLLLPWGICLIYVCKYLWTNLQASMSRDKGHTQTGI
jgi:hypothetical protein